MIQFASSFEVCAGRLNGNGLISRRRLRRLGSREFPQHPVVLKPLGTLRLRLAPVLARFRY